ncbi:VOC family protein [Vitiosangium sp. GDMCC 1.1324]|uniref:VOC family protein n=1 Tax=Vitiosangium sp. (strain GDMCC 1.1324) TaxID=2138576 RepID=UPI000D36B32C|nr:VOC family protein [Vitiosangium sp. GDMCC 1.1324]PTL78787.1 glyoxalase/bleomycin resistance/extradiol dioxygenase family protein [Vitiosangium sp. GDMCC 1.1324]
MARKPNVRVQPLPLIAVNDVEASSRFYRKLLGCESGHGGRTYETLVNQGNVVLQLHAWDEEEHPNLMNRDEARPGHGVLLWFQINEFESAVERAHSLRARIVEEVHVNPNSGQQELWLADPDGYLVVLADGD